MQNHLMAEVVFLFLMITRANSVLAIDRHCPYYLAMACFALQMRMTHAHYFWLVSGLISKGFDTSYSSYYHLLG